MDPTTVYRQAVGMKPIETIRSCSHLGLYVQ